MIKYRRIESVVGQQIITYFIGRFQSAGAAKFTIAVFGASSGGITFAQDFAIIFIISKFLQVI